MKTLSQATHAPKSRRQQRGLGLVEIMISMVLVGIMFNGLMEIFLSSRQNFTATDNMTRLQENGRAAVDILVSSLRRSGYMGGNSNIALITGSLGPSTNATTCAPANSTWGRMIGQGQFGLNDQGQYGLMSTIAGYDCIEDDDYLGGDVLTVRYASPWTVATADFVSTRVYLRSSLFQGKIFLGGDEDDNLNTVFDNPQRQHELLAYAYYVGPTGRSCSGAPIPALFRQALDVNNLPVREELIAGVENIQFQYNVGDMYVDADNVADWDDVLSVKLWVLARSECPEGSYLDGRTYVLGDVSPNYVPADGYRRQLYSTVVALRN